MYYYGIFHSQLFICYYIVFRSQLYNSPIKDYLAHNCTLLVLRVI